MRCDYDRAEDFRLISGRVGAMLDISMNAVNSTWSPVIGEVERWLLPAIQLNQNMIFTDQVGKPFAYVTWAFLSPRNHQRMLEDQAVSLRLEDWAEGPSLWIVDAISISGAVQPLLEWGASALGELTHRKRQGDRFIGPVERVLRSADHEPETGPAQHIPRIPTSPGFAPAGFEARSR